MVLFNFILMTDFIGPPTEMLKDEGEKSDFINYCSKKSNQKKKTFYLVHKWAQR